MLMSIYHSYRFELKITLGQHKKSNIMNTKQIVLYVVPAIFNLYYYFGYKNRCKTIGDYVWRILVSLIPGVSLLCFFARVLFHGVYYFIQNEVPAFKDYLNEEELFPEVKVYITSPLEWYIILWPMYIIVWPFWKLCMIKVKKD